MPLCRSAFNTQKITGSLIGISKGVISSHLKKNIGINVKYLQMMGATQFFITVLGVL
jgi:hypothetical protein